MSGGAHPSGGRASRFPPVGIIPAAGGHRPFDVRAPAVHREAMPAVRVGYRAFTARAPLLRREGTIHHHDGPVPPRPGHPRSTTRAQRLRSPRVFTSRGAMISSACGPSRGGVVPHLRAGSQTVRQEHWHAAWSQDPVMWIRLLACSLGGSPLLACGGGSDVAGSPTAVSDDAGVSPDAGAPEDRGTLDATAAGAADAMVDAGAADAARCQWPGYLNPPTVGRYLLSCRVAPVDGGLATSCISNDPSTCPAPPIVDGYGAAVMALVDCVDQCKPDEYALSVGGSRGAPPGPTAPPGCRGFGHAMYGSTFFCCPCEAADAGADLDAAAVDSGQPGEPTCSADENCTYMPNGQQCLPRCDEQGGCPTGEECKTMVGCCAGTGCEATPVRVCCPPTGC